MIAAVKQLIHINNLQNIIKFNSNFAIDDWNTFLKELALKIKSSEAIITL